MRAYAPSAAYTPTLPAYTPILQTYRFILFCNDGTPIWALPFALNVDADGAGPALIHDAFYHQFSVLAGFGWHFYFIVLIVHRRRTEDQPARRY